MKKLIMILLLCVITAGAASAQVDEDPDQMGIYFDTDATVYCIPSPPLVIPVPVYVIYTTPTLESIEGFEFGITLEGDPEFLIWSWGDLIFIVPPELDNIKILLPEPCPTTSTTVLACADYLYLESMPPVTFFLHGAREYSTGDPALPGIYYSCGDETCVLPVGTSTAPGTPGAQIGGICGLIVDAESETWGGLKSLYR